MSQSLVSGCALLVILSMSGSAESQQSSSKNLAPTQTKTRTPPWELARAKVDAARRTCQSVAEEYLQGKASVEQVHLWSRRWLDAQRDISTKRSEQISAFEDHVERMRQLEQAAKNRVESRQAPASEASAAEYHRLEAELSLSRAKTSR
jgi:neutral trehalase